MGQQSLDGMLEYGQDIRVVLGWHLSSNHFPPVPASMIDPCLAAIDAYFEDDLDREIELPEETSWRGKSTAPAWAIIEGHHLEGFLGGDDE